MKYIKFLFFVLIHVLVVLFWLVGGGFSININEWAQAEKCLAGWARPVTETEDEAVLWAPISCEWRKINFDTDGIIVWLRKMCETDIRWCRRMDEECVDLLEGWCWELACYGGSVRVYRSFCLLFKGQLVFLSPAFLWISVMYHTLCSALLIKYEFIWHLFI